MIRYGIKGSKRVLSTQAAAILYTEMGTDSLPKTAGSNSGTVKQYISQIPSSTFINTLSKTHFGSVIKQAPQLKLQMYNLVKDKQYDMLLEVLQKVMKLSWSKYFKHTEVTYFIGELIDHQINMMLTVTKLKAVNADYQIIDERSRKADKLRTQIRGLYSKLLFKKSFIYSKERRVHFDDAHDRTEFQLSISDYQNLIKLEYSNSKPDLVNKWFQRFDQSHSVSEYTQDMWDIKFKLSGADPNLWSSFNNGLYYQQFKKPKALYQKQNFNEVLSKYMEHGTIGAQITNITLCLGARGEVTKLQNTIETYFGIDAEGKKVHEAVGEPDYDLLNAIVVGLSFNKKYFEAMRYMNAFQEHFSLDLESNKAQYLWDNLIKWTDLNTRFKHSSTLHYFIENYNPKVKSSKLKELLNDVNFDYERYLLFINDLKQKRSTIMTEFWKFYCDGTRKFSVSTYRIYARFLLEQEDDKELYEFLQRLNGFYAAYYVSPNSFNYKYLGMNTVMNSIEGLYKWTLQKMITVKLEKGLVGQVEPLIEEWALNDQMKQLLFKYYLRVFPSYQSKLDALPQEDQDDSLLELF